MQFSKWNLNLLVWIKFLNLFLYIVLNKNWNIYWSEQSFTGLGPEDRCSSWGLSVFVFLHFLGSISSRPRESTSSLSSMLPPEDISPVLGVRPLGSLSHSDASSVFTHHSHLPKSKNMSQSRKLSLDPHVRLKIEKLEVVSRIWLFF